MDKDEVQLLIDYVDGIYVHCGAPDTTFGDNTAQVHALERLASKNNLTLIPSRIRHIGTDRCEALLQR